jgi:hypothetical protein
MAKIDSTSAVAKPAATATSAFVEKENLKNFARLWGTIMIVLRPRGMFPFLLKKETPHYPERIA